jgi:hypothetical protein
MTKKNSLFPEGTLEGFLAGTDLLEVGAITAIHVTAS